jgi:hypothetical protein
METFRPRLVARYAWSRDAYPTALERPDAMSRVFIVLARALLFGLFGCAGLVALWWWAWLQYAAGALLIPFLLWYYARFVRSFYAFATRYVGLFAILALLYALVYAQLGTGLGIPYLFWHEDFPTRVSAALGATLLLAVVGVIAYYLDPYPWATDQKTADWLAIDEYLRGSVAAWWSRVLTPPIERIERAIDRVMALVRGEPAPARPPRAVRPLPAELERPPRPVDRFVFRLNAIIDPISVLPPQSWLDPPPPGAGNWRGWGNQVRLQRFLRTCRTPFLLLLLAPAALPAVFTQVPRVAPTGKLWRAAPPVYDSARELAGYALSLATWYLGVGVGVLAVKLLIRLSRELYVAVEALNRWGVIPDSILQSPADVPPDDVPLPDREAWVRRAERCPLGEDCPVRAGCPRSEPVPGGERAPGRCLALWQKRIAIAAFFLIFLATYAAMGNIPLLYQQVLSPAFAICAALGIAAMAYALIAFLPKWVQVPLFLLAIGWLGFANNLPFKDRFENMVYDDGRLVDLRDRVDAAYFEDPEPGEVDASGLASDTGVLTAWAERTRADDPDAVDGKPKLVVVAVSGGAARSAYWTAVVLDRLERELPGFGRRVRIVCGASGGMLGAACYAAYRRDVATMRVVERQGALPSDGLHPARPADWVERVPCNSIEPLAKFIALGDVWQAVWPYPVWEDRGTVLERDWTDIRFPVADLAPLERRGSVPSLIFSPMLVEDGRRLLISNLDLFRGPPPERQPSPMILTRGRQISQANKGADSAGTVPQSYSLSALEYFRIFPDDRGLLLSSATRMSATFPYVSPAVNLPTMPPRRVVDAGYYDNYGIQVAAAWIAQNHRWLAANTSGVLLLQVRDSTSVKERLDVDDAPATWWGGLMRGFQFLTSPIDGFDKARYAASSFRNDDDVQALNLLFEGLQSEAVVDPRSFFTTAVFENSAQVTIHDDVPIWFELGTLDSGSRPGVEEQGVTEVAMSWYLTRAERLATRRAIPADPIPPDPHPATAYPSASQLATRALNAMSREDRARLYDWYRKRDSRTHSLDANHVRAELAEIIVAWSDPLKRDKLRTLLANQVFKTRASDAADESDGAKRAEPAAARSQTARAVLAQIVKRCLDDVVAAKSGLARADELRFAELLARLRDGSERDRDELNDKIDALRQGGEAALDTSEAAALVRLLIAQLRVEGRLAFPPGPERDLRFKRLEQLRNYERMVNLKRWWTTAGQRKSVPDARERSSTGQSAR